MDRSSTIMWVGTVRALPLAEQLKAARLAGCDAISITPYNYTKWLLEGLSTKDMLVLADDNGVKLTQLDPYARWATHWFPDNLDPAQFPIPFFGYEGEDFFRIAEALQVDSMSAIITCPQSQVSIDQLIEGFAQTCDRAATMGMRCDLEFIPFWGMPDLETAWKIVKTADKANSGIVFDFWHYLRGKPDPALLDTIPGEKISTVQIADADAALKPGRSMLDDCVFHRVAPGDGGFPVVELLQQLHRIGGLNRFGPEIFSAAFDKLSAEEIGQRCQSSFARAFDLAGIPHRFDAAKAAA
ncbi:sugar phosphate isomerase/epimerase family protein [Labrys sp. La1]|uniref:sugar phosphate isomerase/epimerase family protein n=1 Tax=Labrys sp. La1 TaxID=3404917 RepID=UPI003EBF33EF